MNLDNNLYIYIMEVILIPVIFLFFYRYKQKKNTKIVEKLQADIKLLIDKQLGVEGLVGQQDTSSGTSKIEYLEKKIQRLYQIIEDTKNIAQNASMIKSDFLANVRHEVRTPMNSILVFAELIEKETQDKRLNGFAKNIFYSGNKLLTLLTDIIELSKIESGTFEIIESAVDIRSLFLNSVEEFRNQADKKDLKLSIEIDENVPISLMIDSLRVEDILNNLLSNAIKFTHKGFVKVLVSIDNVDEVNNVVDLFISIKDSGIGIASKNQNKIFEIFETKSNCDDIEYQGTGLGLSINRKLSKIMGGDLSVKSELSVGSTFILSLRNIEIVLFNSKKGVDESKIDFSLIKPEGAKILVVCNSELDLDLAKESFVDTNSKVLTFNNARSAIESLKRQEVDLILIDVDMLSNDEGAVSKVMKKVTTAPVITLTNTRLKDIVFQVGGIRPIGHLKKPLTKIELFKVTLKVLNSHASVLEENGSLSIKNVHEHPDNINLIQLKIFLHVQKIALQEIYEEAISTNDLNTINSFATELLELSIKHKLKDLIIYSELLLNKVDLFEIDTINKMLPNYEEKIKEYELMIEK
ncbi:ATP-binding protein [Sulfurimonas sp.]|uniref:ATP-binding protein n=1 Tax=Sulfurimonas sp. TaxID=2022749 RepID=UPI002B46F100|nr:ATP-binding protein [Sulfurimonas sp.]